MPTLSRFYGISLKMFLRNKEHNPPHVHAVYGEYMGEFDLQTFEMLVGDLPAKARKMVVEWMQDNQAALLEIWETQEFRALPPLE